MPTFPSASHTTRTLSAGVFSALAARAARHPRPVAPLHVGDTWREPWEGARAEDQRTADHPGLHTYSPVSGEPALLAAISRHLARRLGDAGLPPSDARPVCVVSGATSGLSVVCQALLDPGDELLLPSPFWPLIRGIAASRGAIPVEVPCWDRLDSPGFSLEDALEAAVTPRTAAIYLNSPHNPTGRTLSPAELEAVARVATRHDLWVFCDEVYELLYFGERATAPTWAHPALADRAVAIHSVSKAYGLAGARVGWIHGPRAAMDAITAVQTFQVYCAAKPMQLGAARALDGAGAWLDETRRLYRDAARLTAATFDVPMPTGGTFIFADVSRWMRAGEDLTGFLTRCLDDADVLLTPGTASGKDFERSVRISFTAVPPDALAAAMTRLEAVLRAPAR